MTLLNIISNEARTKKLDNTMLFTFTGQTWWCEYPFESLIWTLDILTSL